MPVVSTSLELAYFDITKVASTSIKRLLRELENANSTQGLGKQEKGSVHNGPGWLRTRKFKLPDGTAAEFHRFAVVRDPILRLRSAWRDKITGAQLAKRPEQLRDLKDEYLSIDPSFGELISNFDAYRMISRPARLHTTPYTWHIGDDLSIFDSLYRLEEVSDLEAFISGRVGHSIRLPFANESSNTLPRDDSLTAKQIDKLVKITAPDYALLNGLYTPDAALAHLS